MSQKILELAISLKILSVNSSKKFEPNNINIEENLLEQISTSYIMEI